MTCPYSEGDRVKMRYGLATVADVNEHPNTDPPSWTLGVVADVGQYWLCSQEEIESMNPGELPNPTIESGTVRFYTERWTTEDGKIGWMIREETGGWRTPDECETKILEKMFVATHFYRRNSSRNSPR
jgi:hypothetical protein